MNLEGRKIIVNKSGAELVEMLNTPEGYRALMPDSLQSFEVRDQGFKFSLKGMPEIALEVKEVEKPNKVVLGAISDKIPFTLTALIEEVSENASTVELLFEGKFNTMMSMMVKGPISKFIETLASHLEQV